GKPCVAPPRPPRLSVFLILNQNKLLSKSGTAAVVCCGGGGPGWARGIPGGAVRMRVARGRGRRAPLAGSRHVRGVRARAAAREGGGEPGHAAAAAGGERSADPVHRGVPEQGPRHRLRAVSDPRGRGGRSAGAQVSVTGAERGSSSSSFPTANRKMRLGLQRGFPKIIFRHV
ncbi:hypothetical protein Nmel_012398, partial [Mimus melanotis]